MKTLLQISLRSTDIVKNTWLFRNPHNQSEVLEIPAYSVILDKKGYAPWDKVLNAHRPLP